jgi:methoxymalonate biosynthesis acyl carrier protein
MPYRERVRKYIEENLILFGEKADFTDEDNIFQRGFVSSLFAMQLLTYIEQEFHIVVDSEDMEISNFSSVTAIVQLIEKKLR